MMFFDAHCDTVLKVIAGKLDFVTGEGKTHVTLPGMLSAGSCAQVFACFVLSEEHPGREQQVALGMIQTIAQMATGSEGRMKIALSASELRSACDGGPIAALIGLEGADPLEGRAENLHYFYELGVRDLILAWKDNAFTGTTFGRNTPLTEEGKKLVAIAEELKVMVDVSHLSDAAFDDICDAAKRPFIASHSNCRALCPDRRNLTDSMIHMLAERGGVMGINLSSDFLDPVFREKLKSYRREVLACKRTPEEVDRFRACVATWPCPPIDWVTRHILHAINVGGEDCVGLGGDLDGVSSLPEGLEGIADYGKIPDLLLSAGLSAGQVEKVCYQNLKRVFCDVLPA